ncbi:myb-related transcription factor, partner of profilin-like [Ambystoma mexicanum]|uniref:myb-related transcription factor, partner of profilin-like n=1 Tax=Ambystoma mexicanum TaxID=8296 RepID=UPI0037E80781
MGNALVAIFKNTILSQQHLDQRSEQCGSKQSNMASRQVTVRRQKPRFCDVELNMLADTLVEHADVVFCADLCWEAQMHKKAVWKEVVQKVSAVRTTPRTVRDCRKRWDNLQLRVRNFLSANRSQGMATGGGAPSPIKLAPWEETCSTVMDMESIKGVGDAEMGVPKPTDDGTGSDSESERTPTPKKATARWSRGDAAASSQGPSTSSAGQKRPTATTPQPPNQEDTQAGQQAEHQQRPPSKAPQQRPTAGGKAPQKTPTGGSKVHQPKGTPGTKALHQKNTSGAQEPPQVEELVCPVASDMEEPQSTATSDLGEAAQSAQHSEEEEEVADTAGNSMHEDQDNTPPMQAAPRHSPEHGLGGHSSVDDMDQAVYSPRSPHTPPPVHPPAAQSIRDL